MQQFKAEKESDVFTAKIFKYWLKKVAHCWDGIKI
jgi:hypothetical protein